MGNPPAARLDLARVGLVMDPSLAALDKFEMLDGIGDVNRGAVDPRFLERRIEQRAGGTDERPPGKVLLVAGLLADEHDRGVEWALAEHRLGGMLVEIAAGAVAGVLEQRFPRPAQITTRLDRAFRRERIAQASGRNVGHRFMQRANAADVASRAAPA